MSEEKTNILLVDDHPENLLALEALLEDLNQNLVRAETGREALRLVLQQEFAVILLDVEMPLLNGFETATLIRSRDKSRHTPIIFLTAHNRTEEHIFKGYSLGAVDYLTKPFVSGILRSKVMVFVELYKQREQSKHHAVRLNEANRFISAILDNAASIVLVVDQKGCIVQSNRAFERILGFSSLEAVGRRVSDFIRPDTENEAVCIAKDGTQKIIAWTKTRIGDTPDTALSVFTGNDITERKRAEEERLQLARTEIARLQAEQAQRRSDFLAHAGARLASTLDYEETLRNVARLPVPEFADWSFVLATRGTEVSFFVWHEDPVRCAFAQQLYPSGTAELPTALGIREVFETGSSKLISHVADSEIADATLRELLAKIGSGSAIVAPIKTRQNTLGVYGWVSRNSARYGAAEVSLAENLAGLVGLTLENVQLYRDVQQASQAKDQFLATLSHEIRTPMNAILGWLNVLQTKKLDEVTTARAMDALRRNAKAQFDLIEDMLDVSRVITGRLSLECRAIELSMAIDGALDSVRPAAEAKNVRLNCEIDVPGSQLWGDPARLQQVIWNLLSNAIKFTPPGGEVTIRLRQGATDLELSVTDTGKGIPADFLPFVFDRFRQGEGSMNRRHGGLGLGLSIARHLVELHGGTIEAFSAGEGKGSTFTVSLPRRAVAELRAVR